MIPYKLFYISFCAQNGGCNIKEEDFDKSRYHNFFLSLNNFFKTKLKFNDKKIVQYIDVCAKIQGNNFNCFELNSEKYLEDFKQWYEINSSLKNYYKDIKECIDNIVEFCKKNNVRTLEKYILNWGITQYIANKLNDNVAFYLGLHKLELSKPEKFMIKKFLKNVHMTEERIKRDKKLQETLESEVKEAKEKLRFYFLER